MADFVGTLKINSRKLFYWGSYVKSLIPGPTPDTPFLFSMVFIHLLLLTNSEETEGSWNSN